MYKPVRRFHSLEKKKLPSSDKISGREMIRDVNLLADNRFPGSFVYREVYY
jgi:hypothetical protein